MCRSPSDLPVESRLAVTILRSLLSELSPDKRVQIFKGVHDKNLRPEEAVRIILVRLTKELNRPLLHLEEILSDEGVCRVFLSSELDQNTD